MSIHIVGNAADREEWLEKRKGYLTASSVYAWRGPAHADPKNSWYFEDNNRDTILAEKLEGFEKEFHPYAAVSMEHGKFDEENIMHKLATALGTVAIPDNSMFVNDRWPHLAATVDGFIDPPPDNFTPGPPFCQDPDVIPDLRDMMMAIGETMVCEIKKSVSVGWSRGNPPEYYLAQVQTQMTILEMDHAVLCAECIFTDPKEKWRKYWDLRPFLIVRDPAWEKVLDECNEEFALAAGLC